MRLTLLLCATVALTCWRSASGADFRRGLAGTTPQCMWDGTSCTLDSKYITTIPGSPTSDSAKFLAAYAYRSTTECGKYNTSSQCYAATAQQCSWYGNVCGLEVTSFFDPNWYRGTAYCANSLMDQAVTCAQLKSTADCSANTNCMYTSTTAYNNAAGAVGVGLLSVVMGFASADISANGSACFATWSVDPTRWQSLAAAMNSSISALIASGSFDLGGLLGVILTKDFVGDCAAATRYRDSVTQCTSRNTSATCTALPTCQWEAGSCFTSDTLHLDVLLDSNDPWVQAWKDATSTCATATTSTACASKATFEYDAAKLATFASAWPAFTSLGAGGNAPPGSSAPPPPSPGAALPARLPLLLLSALLALASLVVLAV